MYIEDRWREGWREEEWTGGERERERELGEGGGGSEQWRKRGRRGENERVCKYDALHNNNCVRCVHIKQSHVMKLVPGISQLYIHVYIIAQYVNPLRDTEPPQHSVHVYAVRRHPAV